MVRYNLGVPHHKVREKQDNRTQIIETLSEGDSRFGELLNAVDMSRATLDKHLKEMVTNGEVEKKFDQGKSAIVYSLNPRIYWREVLIHDFVYFIGSRIFVQILEKEMALREDVDLREAFPLGTVEDFVDKIYKKSRLSYREILDILKEEYGEWIEKESKEGDNW